MKVLLFLICFCPCLVSGQVKTNMWNDKIQIISNDSCRFARVLSANNKTTFSGNGVISGHVKLKIGNSSISCDLAVIDNNEMIAYNTTISNPTDSSRSQVKADVLKLDLDNEDGIMKGYVFLY